MDANAADAAPSPDDSPTARLRAASGPPGSGGPAGGDAAATPPGPTGPPPPDTGTGGPPPPGAAGPPPPDAAGPPPPGTGGPPPPGAGGPPPRPGTGGPPPPGGPSGASGGRGPLFPHWLVRPLHDRYAAGVCAGLARLTGTDPLLWRVLLAVSALFGVGVLLYLALWLVTPAEGDTGSPLEALLGRGHSRTSGTLTVLLALGVVVGLGGTLDNSAGMLVIGAAIVLGIVLLAGRHGTMPDPVRHLRQAFPPPAPAGAAAPAFPPGAWTPGGPTGPPPPAGPTGPAVPAGYTGGFPFGGPTGPMTPGGPVPPAGAGGAVSAPPAPHTGGDAVPAPPPWGVPHGPPFAPHGPWRHGAGGHGTRRWHGMGFGHRTTAPAEPPPAEARPPRPRRQRSPLGLLTVSLTLLLLAGVAIADLAQAWSPHPGTYVAVAVGMTGLGLVIGAWFGRARLLIVLGTVLALGLGGAGGAERWDDELRQPATVWVPTSAAELQPVYERRLGAATLDLRQVDFTGRQHTVTAIVEFGSMRILVPPAVTVTTVAHTRAGRVTVFGDEYRSRGGGPVRRHDVGAGGPRAGALELHLTARGANLEVIR